MAGCAAALGRAVGRRTAGFAVAALLPIAAQLLAGYADAEWIAATILAVLAAGIVYARTRLAAQLYREGRAVLDVAREATGLPEKTLRALLDPAALAKGGIHGKPGGGAG